MVWFGQPPSPRATKQLILDAEAVKPRMRGRLHLWSLPLALAAGIGLIWISPTNASRVGSSAFAFSGALMFGTSAAYHRGSWSPRALIVMRRFDHCGIYLLIAGSCTAYSLVLLHGPERVALTAIVGTGAFLGILTRLTWPHSPRWVSPPLYVALGLAPVAFSPAMIGGAHELGDPGRSALLLAVAGGVCYVGGAGVYLLQRPDPWPRSFGFHEVFHVFTILGFACHYLGIVIAVVSLS